MHATSWSVAKVLTLFCTRHAGVGGFGLLLLTVWAGCAEPAEAQLHSRSMRPAFAGGNKLFAGAVCGGLWSMGRLL